MSYDIIKYMKMQQKYFVNSNSIALDVKYLQNSLGEYIITSSFNGANIANKITITG